MLSKPLRVAAVGALVITAAGCRTTTILEGPAYPSGTPRSETIDVQVIRRGTRIELTNTTARAFGPGTLWINGWYGREIDGLAVGESLNLRLRDFHDEFGGEFRAGGFFAKEAPDRIVLAELETDGRFLGLVVIDQTD